MVASAPVVTERTGRKSAPNRTSWRPPTCGAVSRRQWPATTQTSTRSFTPVRPIRIPIEAIPADAAAISDASLVVYNGGGYDAWVDGVLAHSDVPTVDAYSLLDAAALGEPQPASEHVFYDLGTAKRSPSRSPTSSPLRTPPIPASIIPGKGIRHKGRCHP